MMFSFEAQNTFFSVRDMDGTGTDMLTCDRSSIYICEMVDCMPTHLCDSNSTEDIISNMAFRHDKQNSSYDDYNYYMNWYDNVLGPENIL